MDKGAELPSKGDGRPRAQAWRPLDKRLRKGYAGKNTWDSVKNVTLRLQNASTALHSGKKYSQTRGNNL